jgi:hypothetical protein
MKTLLAFVMIMGLGLFCAVGCNKPAHTPAPTHNAPPPASQQKVTPGSEKPAMPPAKPEEKPGAKPDEKKPK